MQISGDNPTAVSCKLCATFAASDLPAAAERGLDGSDNFTIDADICDACLHCDYVKRGPRRVETWFAIAASLPLALVVAEVVSFKWQVNIWTRFPRVPFALRLPALVLLAAVPCALVAWLIFCGLRWVSLWRIRDQVQRELDQNREIDSQRFYWLAVWASLTGHEHFKRRMLKQATKLGFPDVRRLRE